MRVNQAPFDSEAELKVLEEHHQLGQKPHLEMPRQVRQGEVANGRRAVDYPVLWGNQCLCFYADNPFGADGIVMVAIPQNGQWCS